MSYHFITITLLLQGASTTQKRIFPEKYDRVFRDMDMSDTDGYEATITIITLTTLEPRDKEQKGLDTG